MGATVGSGWLSCIDWDNLISSRAILSPAKDAHCTKQYIKLAKKGPPVVELRSKI